jgi:hypothetical protein
VGDFLALYLFNLGSAVVMGAWSSWLSLAVRAFISTINSLAFYIALGKIKNKNCALEAFLSYLLFAR